MSTAGENLSQEPQEERGAPGSRDTGSDQPSGGPTDRPSNTYRGDETVPTYPEAGKPGADSSEKTDLPPSDAQPAVPPYEGRQTSAKPVSEGTGAAGAETGGAVKPAEESGYKAGAPGQTPGGTTASPGEEQPASQMPETNRDDDMVAGPAHTPGVGTAEDKR